MGKYHSLIQTTTMLLLAVTPPMYGMEALKNLARGNTVGAYIDVAWLMFWSGWLLGGSVKP